MNNAISVKIYNEIQNIEYTRYCSKCIRNGIIPEDQNRYFPLIPVNYGYVITNKHNEIFWKKRKSDFD